MKLFKNPFRKLTSEEKVNRRSSEVFTLLISKVDLELSDLEKAQVMNNVRKKLIESLKSKKNDLIEQSVNCASNAEEVDSAISKIE